MSYIGIITTTTHLPLYNGERQVTSPRYQAAGDATNWVAVMQASSLKAGRPCAGDVFCSSKKPQILHCSSCGEPYTAKKTPHC